MINLPEHFALGKIFEMKHDFQVDGKNRTAHIFLEQGKMMAYETYYTENPCYNQSSRNLYSENWQDRPLIQCVFRRDLNDSEKKLLEGQSFNEISEKSSNKVFSEYSESTRQILHESVSNSRENRNFSENEIKYACSFISKNSRTKSEKAKDVIDAFPNLSDKAISKLLVNLDISLNCISNARGLYKNVE